MQSEFILSKVKKMEFYRNLANNGISKMRVLVIFQSQCSALGIYLGKASILRNSFNSKNRSVLFVLCCGIVSCCLQLIYEANSFKDLINSIYTISAILSCTTCFCTLIWKSPLLSKYLDKLEKTINKSGFDYDLILIQMQLRNELLPKVCKYRTRYDLIHFNPECSTTVRISRENQSKTDLHWEISIWKFNWCDLW